MVLRCLCVCACSGLPNLAILKEHLLKEGRLTQDAALELIHRASALIKAEPNMLELKYPITGTDAGRAQPHGGGHSQRPRKDDIERGRRRPLRIR